MTNSPAEGNVPQFDMADRLRKALRTADVGVQEMAEYLGVSRNTIGAWIGGRVVPGLAFIRLWAMRTGVSLKWLQTGESPRPVDPDGGELVASGPSSRSVLPRLDSNQKPAGYPGRVPYSWPTAA
jgi:transcriptional regulator with XRE-family HTH domain